MQLVGGVEWGRQPRNLQIFDLLFLPTVVKMSGAGTVQ